MTSRRLSGVNGCLRWPLAPRLVPLLLLWSDAVLVVVTVDGGLIRWLLTALMKSRLCKSMSECRRSTGTVLRSLRLQRLSSAPLSSTLLPPSSRATCLAILRMVVELSTVLLIFVIDAIGCSLSPSIYRSVTGKFFKWSSHCIESPTASITGAG